MGNASALRRRRHLADQLDSLRARNLAEGGQASVPLDWVHDVAAASPQGLGSTGPPTWWEHSRHSSEPGRPNRLVDPRSGFVLDFLHRGVRGPTKGGVLADEICHGADDR